MSQIRTTEEFRQGLTLARRVGTPLIAIRSADPSSAIAHMIASLNGKAEETPLLSYDFVTGLAGRNAPGVNTATILLGDSPANMDPTPALALAQKLPEDAILFYMNPQRIFEQPDFLQGIWNLRDTFKCGGQTLVLICTPAAILPPEIAGDVMVFDEPLPSAADLKTLIAATYKAAGIESPTPEIETKAIDALIGLASFPAEQVLAMSLSKKTGLDTERLWERKRQAVEQTPGLSIWRGGETFAEIGGCDAVKEDVENELSAIDPARTIVFIDEIEKAFAGVGTDTSGVKSGLLGTMLTYLADHNTDGMIFIGPPGAAKSAVAKAAGASAGIPTVSFDLEAMQTGIVGASGERLRTALQVVDAISSGRSLWIATCNAIIDLPPELRRRFHSGTYFFDLPTAQKREAIWKIYETKWKLAGKRPDDTDWTGAEIKQCCRKAYRQGISLMKAGTYIIPVARSAADQILRLRKQSSGKYLSAEQPGVYTFNETPPAPVVLNRRKFADNN